MATCSDMFEACRKTRPNSNIFAGVRMYMQLGVCNSSEKSVDGHTLRLQCNPWTMSADAISHRAFLWTMSANAISHRASAFLGTKIVYTVPVYLAHR